jgi:hypothetical protein
MLFVQRIQKITVQIVHVFHIILVKPPSRLGSKLESGRYPDIFLNINIGLVESRNIVIGILSVMIIAIIFVISMTWIGDQLFKDKIYQDEDLKKLGTTMGEIQNNVNQILRNRRRNRENKHIFIIVIGLIAMIVSFLLKFISDGFFALSFSIGLFYAGLYLFFSELLTSDERSM